jgi:septal ring factor EnvC (AmiA/AmiB activator)
MESWRRARAQYAAVVAERDALRRECDALERDRAMLERDRAMLERDRAMLERELVDLKVRHRELYASVLARYECWQELARLYREREIDRALKVERDPAQSLH